MAPVARHARSGDLHIEYIAEGEGPIDVMWIPPWISQVEHLWSERSLERVAWLRRAGRAAPVRGVVNASATLTRIAR